VEEGLRLQVPQAQQRACPQALANAAKFAADKLESLKAVTELGVARKPLKANVYFAQNLRKAICGPVQAGI
jgi:hypothetical protein